MKTHSMNAARPLELVARMEIEAVEAADGKPALPRFRMVAYTGGPMRIAGWRYPVIVDLAGLSIPSPNRPIRFGHDAIHGVGHTDSIRIEGGQLIATGVVSRDTPTAREVVVSSKNGFPWKASIGASVDEFEFVKESQIVLVNGREFSGPVNVVRKAMLGEISFVDVGADANTSVSVAARAAEVKETAMETADCRLEAEDQKTATEPENTEVQAGGQEADPERSQSDSSSLQSPASDVVTQIRSEAATETQRIAAIRRICAGKHADIEARAISEGWDTTRCELEVLRANRPKAPAMHVSDNIVTGTVLEAACMLTAGLPTVDKLFEPRTLDLADKRFRGGIGLQELLLEAAWANGYTGRNFRDSRSVLRFAFKGDVQAGFSTIDIGGILSNVANKFLLDGFFSVERTWRNICAVRNVSDFKTVTSYRLIGADQYERVAPGGELKHGTLGQESYTNKADT